MEKSGQWETVTQLFQVAAWTRLNASRISSGLPVNADLTICWKGHNTPRKAPREFLSNQVSFYITV